MSITTETVTVSVTQEHINHGEKRPSLRGVILDALEDAYWSRRANVEECRSCAKQPAGVCADHRADSDLSRDYEEARKQLQVTPESPEVLAMLADGEQS